MGSHENSQAMFWGTRSGHSAVRREGRGPGLEGMPAAHGVLLWLIHLPTVDYKQVTRSVLEISHQGNTYFHGVLRFQVIFFSSIYFILIFWYFPQQTWIILKNFFKILLFNSFYSHSAQGNAEYVLKGICK